ncbi:Transcriptional regulator KdgR [Oceanobacillus oncorhynchi]|uniref:Glycerol operon regulatory protein n=1 Tax=Oceanobacillus oncorhynchi TaxID=545501 RepID=A0A0A1MLB4_9BACI|nr:IclR family transcriptional regulator [Oceanobacillus oncorhynchi]CEI80482.1 Transcriptional regulator KdgR [Oceanobacillus oncorhynchi]
MAIIQSVERSLIILEKLSKNPKGMGITELANQLDIAKSTTHRLLTTLMNKGFVIQDEETKNYTLGMKIIELSSLMLEDMNIRSIAKKDLEELGQKINEVVHLCIHENGEVVYIDKFESDQTIRMHSKIGNRGMMHSTGVGKVILSGMTDEQVRNIITAKGMPAKTHRTITDEEILIKRLNKIRELGYEIDDIENEDGIRCVAAPIYDYRGKMIAAFSVSGPENRMRLERIKSELVDLVLETSKNISWKMGYTG